MRKTHSCKRSYFFARKNNQDEKSYLYKLFLGVNCLEKSKSCANFQHTCDLLGKRWTLLIIRSLLSGSKRFKEMTDDIDNISHRVLGERLKNLEQDNYVVRHVYPETPVRIEYELTEKGKDLAETITALERWAEKWTH